MEIPRCPVFSLYFNLKKKSIKKKFGKKNVPKKAAIQNHFSPNKKCVTEKRT